MTKTVKMNEVNQTTISEEDRKRLLAEKVAKIDKDIENHVEIDIVDVVKAMYLSFFGPTPRYNIQQTIAKVDFLEEKSESNQNRIAYLEKSLINLEVENCRTKVILRNVPMSPKAIQDKKEPMTETKQIVEELLNLSDQSLNSVYEFNRFQSKKGDSRNARAKTKSNEEFSIPNVYINFTTILEMKKFFSNLQNIRKNLKFRNLNCENLVPSVLMEEYQHASKEAFRLRKDKKMATKLMITRDGIKLYAITKKDKKDKTKNYTSMDFPRE